ncbi:MAG: hypothetical protein ACK4SX_08455 [Alcanivoracaceae bacterium]
MKIDEAFPFAGMNHLKDGDADGFKREFHTRIASSVSEPAILQAAGSTISMIFDLIMDDILILLDTYFDRVSGMDAGDFAILEAGMPNPKMQPILQEVMERCTEGLKKIGAEHDDDGLREIAYRVAMVIATMMRDFRSNYISLVVELSDFAGITSTPTDRS